MNFGITTERLFLRPLQESDVDLMWPHVSDPEISLQMSWDAHKTKEETLAFIQTTIRGKESGGGIAWGILYQGQLCGIISLEGITRMLRAVRLDTAELGYWIGKDFRNKGLMTEAAKAVIQFAFDKLQLHRITIGHFSENPCSERVIQKLGFRLIGEGKEYAFKHGKWHNHKIYEMLESDWEQALRP